MHDPQNIDINDFVYELPEDAIPKYPLKERDESKLLLYKNGEVSHTVFNTIDQHISPGSLMVFNNTRVIHARLLFRKNTGALIEVFCLEPVDPVLHLLALQSKKPVTWNCIVGNLKRWKSGTLELPLNRGNETFNLRAEITERLDGTVNVRFSWSADLAFSEILEMAGNIPIPPYLNRQSEDSDKETYQTVYAEVDGSVAAPTAGLHFTNGVLNKLRQNGVKTTEVTLHVGAGTFQPVKSNTIGQHKMHHETIFVSRQTLQNLVESDDIIAVGTTSVRTIESLYWLGVKVKNGQEPTNLSQWEAYDLDGNLTEKEAFNALLEYLNTNKKDNISASTGIIIAPGYTYKVVKGIITNFHQPRSTLLLLIAAFTGSNWKTIYDYALKNQFRFLSYGDSSLLLT